MTDAMIAAAPHEADAQSWWRRRLDLAAILSDPVAVAAVNASLILGFCSIFLARSWMAGLWMGLPHGDNGVVDFAAFWASAKATLSGHAAQAYDWRNLQPILERAGGGPVPGKLPIYYPPPFLLLTAPLGLFPYTAAFALWIAAGVAAFVATVRLASRRPAVMVVGLAGMGVFASALVGQNGVYTAACLGAGLVLTDRRPGFAGVLLGLLCCKPQFALLVPIALAAGGRWRAMAATAATAAALAVAAGLVLGWNVYPAFFTASAHARQSFAGAGWLPWAKVQTTYGALRQAQVDSRVAVVGGAVAALSAAAVVGWLWRAEARAPLRVAAAAAGAFLATPYAFTYDAALLALATAFILADVSEARPLSLAEKIGLIIAFLTPFLANPWPTTVPAAVVLLGIAAWRARPSARITEISRAASHPCATVEASS